MKSANKFVLASLDKQLETHNYLFVFQKGNRNEVIVVKVNSLAHELSPDNWEFNKERFEINPGSVRASL